MTIQEDQGRILSKETRFRDREMRGTRKNEAETREEWETEEPILLRPLLCSALDLLMPSNSVKDLLLFLLYKIWKLRP